MYELDFEMLRAAVKELGYDTRNCLPTCQKCSGRFAAPTASD